MQGELFDPMREAVAAGASKPKFVYIYPPQESGEKGERPADAAYFTFRPLHFFELIARESEALEAMLEPGALVWLGVNFDHVESVRTMMEAAGWDIAATLPRKEEEPYFHCAALIEMRWKGVLKKPTQDREL